jgi:hypothetical protein
VPGAALRQSFKRQSTPFEALPVIFFIIFAFFMRLWLVCPLFMWYHKTLLAFIRRRFAEK